VAALGSRTSSHLTCCTIRSCQPGLHITDKVLGNIERCNDEMTNGDD